MANSDAGWPLSWTPHPQPGWLLLATKPDISLRPLASRPIDAAWPQSGRQSGGVPGTVVGVVDVVVSSGGAVDEVVDVVVAVEVVVAEVDVAVDVVVTGTAGGVTTSCGEWSDSREAKATPSCASGTTARVTSPDTGTRPLTSHSAHEPAGSLPMSTAVPAYGVTRLFQVIAVSLKEPVYRRTFGPSFDASSTQRRSTALPPAAAAGIENRRYDSSRGLLSAWSLAWRPRFVFGWAADTVVSPIGLSVTGGAASAQPADGCAASRRPVPSTATTRASATRAGVSRARRRAAAHSRFTRLSPALEALAPGRTGRPGPNPSKQPFRVAFL